jgi:hypothetical protein
MQRSDLMNLFMLIPIPSVYFLSAELSGCPGHTAYALYQRAGTNTSNTAVAGDPMKGKTQQKSGCACSR